ncbi:hypothetical protein KUCAC02_032443 [Chaenocephalus aceratus]|nr:hypothetical protein KUCAC02_032443 [Chaenocephalus aceratus]
MVFLFGFTRMFLKRCTSPCFISVAFGPGERPRGTVPRDGQPGAEPREDLIPVSARQQVRLSRAFAELHIRPSTSRLNAAPPLAGSIPPGLIDLRPRATEPGLQPRDQPQPGRQRTRRHSRSTSALSSAEGYSDRLAHQARMSASVNAMKVLNTGSEVEEAVADAW